MNTRELAAQKVAYAQELFAQDAKPVAVFNAIKEKFGSQITRSTVYRLYHEFHGTEPQAKPRKKKAQKRAAKKTELTKASSIVPLPITITPDPYPSAPTVDALVEALVRAMRKHSIDRIELDVSGDCRIYHRLARHLHVGEDR
jgi:hypothetical protein